MNTLIPMRKVILKFQITDLLIFKTNTFFVVSKLNSTVVLWELLSSSLIFIGVELIYYVVLVSGA